MKTLIVASMKHFEISEFNGQFLWLSIGLLLNLDKFREMLGSAVTISRADGAILRDREENATVDSQHFYGRAIDVILEQGVNIIRAVEMAKLAGFTGIGIYPDSGGIKGRWRMHLDTRPGDRVATWGSVPTADGERVTVALDTALNLFGGLA